jgi:hypothetical protein
MNLDDLQQPTSAASLSRLLTKHYRISIPVDQLSAPTAHHMLESVQQKLNLIRNSPASHVSERNHTYNAYLLTEQLLTKRIDEMSQLGKAQQAADFKGMWGQTGTGITSAAAAVGGALKSIPGAQVQSPVSQVGFKDAIDGVKNLVRVFSLNAKNEFAKILYNHGYSEQKFLNHLDKFQNNQLTPQNLEDFKSVLSDISWRARDVQGIDDELEQSLSKVLSKFKIKAANKEVKENHMRYQQFKTKKKIYESAMADAEVVLAAKDIADRFQDMVESLGKMINEELPALFETIRDTMTAEQADVYNSSATETINAALETIRGSKDLLDSAARVLAGEETAAQPGGSDQSLGAAAGDEMDQVPATASGGDTEPLGRGKR